MEHYFISLEQHSLNYLQRFNSKVIFVSLFKDNSKFSLS